MEWLELKLHEYSIDVDRTKIIYSLTILSSFISVWIPKIPFLSAFSFPITTAGVFAILFLIFDNFLWKLKILRKIGVVQTPNINGTWKGNFKSSYSNFRDAYPATLIIKQTWTKIRIRGKFNNSLSNSDIASIKVKDGSDMMLYYSYRNDKRPEHHELPFSDHSGFCSLEWNEKEDFFEGEYYNNPTNNKYHGVFDKLKRVSKSRQ